jgi:primosomal protein N' (replication factor Y)
MHYPPFGALASVIVRGAREAEALERSAALGRFLLPAPEGVKILGPAAASLSKLKNEYRYQMLIKTQSRRKLTELLTQVREFAAREKWNATSLAIDVDPMTLL